MEDFDVSERFSYFSYFSIQYMRRVPNDGDRFVHVGMTPGRLEWDFVIARGCDPPLGQRRSDDPGMSVELLLELQTNEPWPRSEISIGQAFVDTEMLTRLLGEWAANLRRCGMRFFADDPTLWDDLRRLQARKREQ